jgi:NADP-dependent 3-hydroxy acid dehydrogenase YdfG
MRDISDSVALVTGASSGIGAATARELATEGADVALLARREDRLTALAADLRADHGVEALAVPADVSDDAAVAAAVEETVETLGGLDILVNNAGTAGGGSVDETSTEEFRRVLGVNVEGVFFATREALPQLRGGGRAIFVGSMAGHYPRGYPVYASTKWWLRGFAHCVAVDEGDEGVAVSLISPWATRTEFGQETPQKESHDPGDALEPEHVAEAVAYACRQGEMTVGELTLHPADWHAGAF